MAEHLMKNKLEKMDAADLEITSAGIAAHGGFSRIKALAEVLKERDIFYEGNTPRQLERSVIAETDLILAMTEPHQDFIKELFPKFAEKVYLLSDYACGEKLDIFDPVGGGPERYRLALEIIEKYVNCIAERIII